MTNATPGPVEVTQADRNAAIRLLEAGGQDWQAKEIRLGVADHFPLVQAFARHRIEAARPVSGEPVGYIIAEMLNRKREFERNGIVMTAAPRGMSTLPLYTRPLADHRALVEALGMIRVMLNDHAGKQSIEGDAFKIADATLAALKETDKP
ncbi:MAG: hypothetical protein ABFE07_24405 [Armatimonadia bacterium]